MADSTQVTYRGSFNIKMPSYQYRKSYCGDKTIFWPSYLHNGISYTGKTTSLYWIRALVPSHFSRELIGGSCHSGTDGILYIGRLYGIYKNFFVVGHCYFTTGLTYEIRVQCRTRLSLLAFSLPSKGLTISNVDNFVQLWGIRQPTGQRSNVDIIIGWELEAGRYFSLGLWIHRDLLSKPLRQCQLSDGISKRYIYQWNTVSSVIPTLYSHVFISAIQITLWSCRINLVARLYMWIS